MSNDNGNGNGKILDGTGAFDSAAAYAKLVVELAAEYEAEVLVDAALAMHLTMYVGTPAGRAYAATHPAHQVLAQQRVKFKELLESVKAARAKKVVILTPT